MTKTLFKLRNLAILPMLALSALAFGGCNLVDIEITSPANGAEVVVGEPVTIEVSIAGERAPEVREVAFYRLVTNSNAVLLSRDTRAPYQATWTPSASNLGPVVLQAVATDADGKNLGLAFSEITVVEADHPTAPSVAVVGSLGGIPKAISRSPSATIAVAAARLEGLLVIDLADPTRPSVAGTLDLPGLEFAVAMREGFAYVLEHEREPVSKMHLAVVDVRVPSAPSLASRIHLPGNPRTWGIAVEGSSVYVSSTNAGLHIVDVSDPRAPEIIGEASTTSLGSDLDVDGGIAFISSGNTLSIVDARNPRTAAEVRYRLDSLNDLELDEGRWLRASSGSVLISNASNPLQISLLGGLDFGAKSIAVLGHELFLATAAGVQIADISDPRHPEVVQVITELRDIERLVAAGDLALAVDTSNRLTVLRLNR